jgi:hypothetical protein
MANIHNTPQNSNQKDLFSEIIEEIEIWKPLPNFEDLYLISQFGRVKTVTREYKLKHKSKELKGDRLLKINSFKSGKPVQPFVKVGNKRATTRITISRSVFLAFCEKPDYDDDFIVKQIDGNRNNNHYKNLQAIKFNRTTSKINLIGNEYGDLIVIGKSSPGLWECKCKCGEIVRFNTQSLRNRSAKNCTERCFFIEKKPALRLYEIIYKQYKNAAGYRNLDFNLSIDEFTKIIIQNCFYCGDKPIYKRDYLLSKDDVKYVGVDRINSQEGYSPKNCVPCCKLCNLAKNNTPPEIWLEWIYKISYRKDKIKKFYASLPLQ